MSKSNVQNIEIVDSNFEANALEISKMTSKTIPVDYKSLVPHENNEIFKEGKVEEMKKSIMEIGLQQPIVVIRNNDKYKILCGHTRYEALKQIIEVEGSKGYRFQNKTYSQEIPVMILENIDKITELKILFETNSTQRSLSNEEKRESARKWAMIFDNYKDDPSLKLTNKKKFVAEMVGISDRTAQRTINEMKGKQSQLSEIDKYVKKIESVSRMLRNINISHKSEKEKRIIKLCISELEQEIIDIKIRIQR